MAISWVVYCRMSKIIVTSPMPHSSFYCSFYFLKKPDATSICILMYLLSSHN